MSGNYYSWRIELDNDHHFANEDCLRLIKEDTMQYELKKGISIKALEEAGPKGCAEFQRGLDRFAFLTLDMYPIGLCKTATIPFKDVLVFANQIPGAIPWLIKEGFIAEKREAFDPKKVWVESRRTGEAWVRYGAGDDYNVIATISADGVLRCSGWRSEIPIKKAENGRAADK